MKPTNTNKPRPRIFKSRPALAQLDKTRRQQRLDRKRERRRAAHRRGDEVRTPPLLLPPPPLSSPISPVFSELSNASSSFPIQSGDDAPFDFLLCHEGLPREFSPEGIEAKIKARQEAKKLDEEEERRRRHMEDAMAIISITVTHRDGADFVNGNATVLTTNKDVVICAKRDGKLVIYKFPEPDQRDYVAWLNLILASPGATHTLLSQMDQFIVQEDDREHSIEGGPAMVYAVDCD